MEKDVVVPSRTYFPNLDGLRFIGALIIIILHIEAIKYQHTVHYIDFLRYYGYVGNNDVSLFFVLSGFLITYLLLKEKKENGNINLKAYYARRTLRIWPLYFLIVILGFFVLPYFDNTLFSGEYSQNVYKHFWLNFIGCALFLCPFVRTSGGLPQTIGPIWSVGVEEVFYLCWPLFLRKTRKYILLFIGVVILVVLVRNGFLLYSKVFDFQITNKKIYRDIIDLIMRYKISCMAIGGIGAYLVVFDKKKILNIIYRKDFQWMTYIITIVLLLLKLGVKQYLRETFPSVFYEIYSVLFAIIIVNLATNPKSVLKLDYKWMTYLGRVSYGLYMFHPMMRIFGLELTNRIFKDTPPEWQMNVCLYFFTISFTILASIISYEFFEKRFLKFGKKFVVKMANR